MKILTFFNNKGGVGKTTMVYHIAWMLSEKGQKVIVADFDPQSNLSAMFLSAERLEEVFEKEEEKLTILRGIQPVVEGDPYERVHVEAINENIGLLIGDLSLSTFEDRLSDAWLKCLDKDPYAFKVTSVFNSIIADAGEQWEADIVLVDIGPNLGAINRSVAISSTYLILPVASDLVSLQGIKNLGITLEKWRRRENPRPTRILSPKGEMIPLGYIIMQYAAQSRRPVRAYKRWADRIPKVYQKYLATDTQSPLPSLEADPACLGLLKHYHSLAPMSMEAKKPIFLLKPADGAIGAHMTAVNSSYADFERVTDRIQREMEAHAPTVE